MIDTDLITYLSIKHMFKKYIYIYISYWLLVLFLWRTQTNEIAKPHLNS